MKVAFYSPLPPAMSGIADYSEALLDRLSALVQVEAGNGAKPPDPSKCDVALYQIGNNADHIEAYEAALRHPGVVVLHEANLHHLMADMTIRRKDWDGYLRELEYDGGKAALEFGKRVRALEVGPDYDGVPMLRRLMESARGLITHSRYVERLAREAGFRGPSAVIQHGAWTPVNERLNWRTRLGIDNSTPLIGIFGHLKPYKRIHESLRAFRRVLRHEPRAKLILVGEPHAELALDAMIRTLGLESAVRCEGRADTEAFTGLMSACDIVLNLRFPTVGETSGTLQRALGLGRAVVVSDVGAFAEFPDDICLKVPPGDTEEDLLFHYLNLLVSRPDLAQAMGSNARAWVERECTWDRVARQYADFLASVVEGRQWHAPPAAPAPVSEPVEPAYLASWAAPEARGYVQTHLARLERTLEITPPGTAADRILEMGAYLQITPALKTRLGYGEVRGCYYGPAGKVDHRTAISDSSEEFRCDIDLFDAERDAFPYPGGHFSTVLCCELIEHLTADPMHMMAEINRVLKPGGHLVLTTPNIASRRAISAMLHGYHPGFFPAYIKPAKAGEEAEARHNREYTAKEIYHLLLDAGFEVVRLETGPFQDAPKPELAWVDHLLSLYQVPQEFREEGIYAVGRKSSPVRERWPAWLYS
jgi:glycosyltransferase involved in cell wall biosynthesis/SAM-dependent methyltransferase